MGRPLDVHTYRGATDLSDFLVVATVRVRGR